MLGASGFQMLIQHGVDHFLQQRGFLDRAKSYGLGVEHGECEKHDRTFAGVSLGFGEHIRMIMKGVGQAFDCSRRLSRLMKVEHDIAGINR